MHDRSLSKMNPCGWRTLVELLHWRAYHQPKQRAYTFLVDGEIEEAYLSYAELDRQARAIAAALQEQGAIGQRIILVYSSGLDYIAAFFGCLYAGAIAVPVYPPDPRRLERTLPRFRAIIKDAQPAAALTTSPILSSVQSLSVWGSDLRNIRWLASDKIDDDAAERWREPIVDGDSLAFLQYTSGSTAAPKGVMVSHANIIHNERMLQSGFGHDKPPVGVGWLPLYHDMGLIGNVLQPLFLGSHCILMSPLDFLQKPFRWLWAVSRYKAHSSGGPNFAYDLCVRKIKPEQRAMLDLSSWKVAFSGAEPIRHDTLERFAATFEPCGFRREALLPCYGLAEATLFVSGGPKSAPPIFCAVDSTTLERGRVMVTADDQCSRMLVSCGRTWLNQRLAIVDPETMTRCPPDRVGEVWVAGPHVALGYWNQPEDTQRIFEGYLADTQEGPFLRTGDLGFLKDGELFITGRIKDMIIIDGRNLYPQDIELTVEQSHPAVRLGCCAAFSVDKAGEEQLVVVAEIDHQFQTDQRPRRAAPNLGSALDTAPDGKEIVRIIRQAVAEYHNVRVHDVVLLKISSISKTSSGKLQRHACRAAYLRGNLNVYER